MTEELKPCPFCGGKVTLTERDPSEGYRYLIRCENCEGDFNNPEKVVADFCFCSDDKEAIIKKWNTRVKDAEPVRHGKWIFESIRGHAVMTCSECCRVQDGQTLCFTYCLNCGARMDK
jgi:Lar family restriction alleviation protein